MEANETGRKRLARELSMRQIEYVPSQTNFVFFRPIPGVNLEEEFLRRGVIVRHFGEDWLRVTIGTPEEMNRFLSELDKIRQQTSGMRHETSKSDV